MSASRQFNQAVREWAEVFTHHNIRAALRFAKVHGLSMGQMSTLMRLHHEGVCGVSDIGAQLGVTSAAASQMIDRLAHMGLIARTEDPNDRRVKQLTLTGKGSGLLQKARAERDRWLEGLGLTLDPERQAAVIAALGYLIEAARKVDNEV